MTGSGEIIPCLIDYLTERLKHLKLWQWAYDFQSGIDIELADRIEMHWTAIQTLDHNLANMLEIPIVEIPMLLETYAKKDSLVQTLIYDTTHMLRIISRLHTQYQEALLVLKIQLAGEATEVHMARQISEKYQLTAVSDLNNINACI